ncbi:unnamed protein product [Ectocarpus fasciculatus]
MVERVNDDVQDVKQRTLRITWKTERPTDEELLDAFRPLGDVVRVQAKERCAAILFASAEPVTTAVAFATAAVEDSPWNDWVVQPMAEIVHVAKEKSKLSRKKSDDEGPQADVNRQKHRDTIPQETLIHQERGGMARECIDITSDSKDTAPAMDKVHNNNTQRRESNTRSESHSGDTLEGQRQREEGSQNDAEEKTPSPRDGVASHSSPRANDALRDTSDVFRQEPSPLSSPEGLVAPPMWEEDKGVELGETVNADRAHGEGGSGSDHGGAGDTSCPRTPEDVRGDASGADDDDPLPHLLHVGEATPLATDKRPEAATCQQSEDGMHSTSGMKIASVPAATISDKVEAAGTKVTSSEQNMLIARSGNYSLEQGDETGASEHQKTRDQAKRLALEVARLRSSLRATTSELNTERSTRVRLEDEWWRRMQEWEEKRGCLVTSKQEAERTARAAEEDVARLLVKEKDREGEVASERLARETRQETADIAMKGVVKVQDRLIQALRTELEMTDRARRAAQDTALETKDQLRLYVDDFLLWRNRAKHLEALLIDLGHPPQPGFHAETPLSCGSPSSKEHKRPEAPRQQNIHDNEQEVDPRTSVAEEPVEYGGSMQAGDAKALSIPEKYARYFETTTGGNPALPSNAAFPGTHRTQQGSELDSETAAAAAAWSTRAAIAGPSSSSSSSRAYFQRSMKAQQEISVRLGKDLARARADLQSIYESNQATARRGGGDNSTCRGLLPETGGTSEAVSSEGAQGNGTTGRNDGDSPSHEDERRVQDRTAVQGVATQDNVSAPAASFPQGSHMARVLAVLLGEDSTSNGTGVPEFLDASTPSRRLTDYPPMLQAVFGGGPAAPLPDSVVAPRRRVMVSGAQRGQTGQGCGDDDGGRFPTQPRSHRRTLTEEQQQARPTAIHPQVDRRHGAGATENCTEARVLNRTCGGNGDRGSAGCRPEDKAAVERGSGEPDDVDPGGRESRSLAKAFRGYEAKSSLLQRWLGEKRYPSPSRAMPVT